jgi:hypothetical protein
MWGGERETFPVPHTGNEIKDSTEVLTVYHC